MNRGDLVDRVSAKTGLSNTAGTEELSLLQKWANEGVVEVLLETHIFIQIGDLSLQSGQAEYRLGAEILAIDDGRGSTPAGIGPYVLIGMNEMLERQSANIVSAGYRKYIAIEGNLMVVSPTPESNETLRFFHVPRPTEMTQDSHDPSAETYGGIPTEHHRAIEAYMTWRASEFDEKTLPMSPKDYFDLFRAECALVRQRKRGMRGRRLLPGRVGYPGSRRIPLRNDVYPR